MSGGRWQYKWHTVTVDGNSQEVRGLTHGERLSFGKFSKTAKAQGIQAELPGELLKLGCKDLSVEDRDAMPAELVEACCEKIMALSGMGDKKPEPEPEEPEEPVDPEKKATPPSPTP